MSHRATSRPPVYIPHRGDIIHTDFSPSSGSEMALKHYALVLTPKAYHEKTGRAIVCPLTSNLKQYPFKYPIPPIPPSLPKAGAVIADQVRAIDLHARGSLFTARVDDDVMREIVDLLFALLESDA